MAPTPWTFLAAALAGLCGGTLSGLFGVGGGIVLVPLLGLLLGLNQHQAQGMTLAVMLFPNSLPAVFHYRKQGVPILWLRVFRLMVGFLGGVWFGALAANQVPERGLRLGFVAFLVYVAWRTYRGAGHSTVETGVAEAWRSPATFAIGLIGGLASGLLGIGGAILMIPLMSLWLGLAQHEAQLASLVMLLPPLGLPAVWEYARHQGGLPWGIVLGVILGFVAGAAFGARVATRMGGPALKRAFAGVALLMALLLLLRSRA